VSVNNRGGLPFPSPCHKVGKPVIRKLRTWRHLTARRVTRAVRLWAAVALALPVAVVAVALAPPAHALGNGLALTPPMGWNDWNGRL
jgi:hypothetical protein